MSLGTYFLLALFWVSSSGWTIKLQPPTSAEICGACHRDIEAGWKQSAHSQAMESRLFQDALQLAETDFGGQIRRTCLGCHSPIAVKIGDLNLVRKVSWEGVTCDYCHSIRSVTLGGRNPKVVVDFSLVKSGPWKNVTSPVHGTVYSPVHTTARICAPCHEYRNATGFAVLTTYDEWKAGPYAAAGVSCQACHMSKVQGSVVDARVKRVSQHLINFHAMPGSHSIEQLNKSVRMEMNARRQGAKVLVTVELTNRGAGHDVPTGSPLRKLILKLHASPYGGKSFTAERVYQRTVADRHGKILNLEPLVFIKAAKVVSDTRLKPMETRTEHFSFPVPEGKLTEVEADLYYFYSPMATAAKKEVKFLTLRRLVQ